MDPITMGMAFLASRYFMKKLDENQKSHSSSSNSSDSNSPFDSNDPPPPLAPPMLVPCPVRRSASHDEIMPLETAYRYRSASRSTSTATKATTATTITTATTSAPTQANCRVESNSEDLEKYAKLMR